MLQGDAIAFAADAVADDGHRAVIVCQGGILHHGHIPQKGVVSLLCLKDQHHHEIKQSWPGVSVSSTEASPWWDLRDPPTWSFCPPASTANSPLIFWSTDCTTVRSHSLWLDRKDGDPASRRLQCSTSHSGEGLFLTSAGSSWRPQKIWFQRIEILPANYLV